MTSIVSMGIPQTESMFYRIQRSCSFDIYKTNYRNLSTESTRMTKIVHHAGFRESHSLKNQCLELKELSFRVENN
ncbi:Protein CBG27094 [Caenorhabditis briggsae]|uniref:Protein CBG27094 n=1 Tax=Caenorhabditis briggsae TaxID=6238 RepID=B6IHH0_CAEBR|nr:Protein CBG27094 [Caenorhabditis briggsae]CAR99350.1 Protein CBG27094 [Caenorhabditis briggsae]